MKTNNVNHKMLKLGLVLGMTLNAGYLLAVEEEITKVICKNQYDGTMITVESPEVFQLFKDDLKGDLGHKNDDAAYSLITFRGAKQQGLRSEKASELCERLKPFDKASLPADKFPLGVYLNNLPKQNGVALKKIIVGDVTAEVDDEKFKKIKELFEDDSAYPSNSTGLKIDIEGVTKNFHIKVQRKFLADLVKIFSGEKKEESSSSSTAKTTSSDIMDGFNKIKVDENASVAEISLNGKTQSTKNQYVFDALSDAVQKKGANAIFTENKGDSKGGLGKSFVIIDGKKYYVKAEKQKDYKKLLQDFITSQQVRKEQQEENKNAQKIPPADIKSLVDEIAALKVQMNELSMAKCGAKATGKTGSGIFKGLAGGTMVLGGAVAIGAVALGFVTGGLAAPLILGGAAVALTGAVVGINGFSKAVDGGLPSLTGKVAQWRASQEELPQGQDIRNSRQMFAPQGQSTQQ